MSRGRPGGGRRRPEAMAVAVPRHYELLDEAIVAMAASGRWSRARVTAWWGRSVGRRTRWPPRSALQRAFAAEAWPEGAELRVRIAVHTGEAQLRDDGNYVGQTLNRGARIRATGHGGQVLVSAATAALVADRLPAGATLVDLGPASPQGPRDGPSTSGRWSHPDLPSRVSAAAVARRVPSQPARPADAAHRSGPARSPTSAACWPASGW